MSREWLLIWPVISVSAPSHPAATAPSAEGPAWLSLLIWSSAPHWGHHRATQAQVCLCVLGRLLTALETCSGGSRLPRVSPAATPWPVVQGRAGCCPGSSPELKRLFRVTGSEQLELSHHRDPCSFQSFQLCDLSSSPSSHSELWLCPSHWWPRMWS